ncbi:uncharacterized protein LOC114528693 [Dendronephthya gigantea]|uniref:uncharacterized protein LOC114528693 n=1 Tax=Dendronephthya gigantea TaxID=151771 RepID=UPI00106B5361|nr:uncharacterized protein LOC114528693 [Dendronephthya gigantea]
MASKKRETRGPKWNSFELKLFALVLADDENDFALTLESLALKKSANIHVFESIKKEFDEKLRTQTLATTETTQNETEQPSKSRKKEKRKTIDTSIPKLRAKYKWMKDKWKQYTDRAKSGSGKASFDEPEWFHIIDPILSETNAKLKLATKADDLNSSLSEDSDYAKSDDGKEFESNKIQLSTRDLQPSPLSIGSNTSSFDGTESTNLDQTCSSADEDEGNNSSSNAKEVSKKEAVKSSVFVQPKKRKVTSQRMLLLNWHPALIISKNHRKNAWKCGQKLNEREKKLFYSIKKNKQS